MIESPVLQKLESEWTCKGLRKAILHLLTARFGAEAANLKPMLDTIDDDARLAELVESAWLCADLKAFQEQLSS